MADKNSKSAKAGRNTRGRTYTGSGGEGRHNARTAKACGCAKPINHTRKNRGEHEREKQAKARASRVERGLSVAPRGRRGPAVQPKTKAA